MVFAYSKIGQVIDFNIETINSFCLPHLVKVSVFRMLNVCYAFVMVTRIDDFPGKKFKLWGNSGIEKCIVEMAKFHTISSEKYTEN